MVLTLCPRLPRQPNNSLNPTRPRFQAGSSQMQVALIHCEARIWARRLAQKGWAAPHENILPLRNEQRRTPGVQNGSQVFTMNEAPCAQAHERKT